MKHFFIFYINQFISLYSLMISIFKGYESTIITSHELDPAIKVDFDTSTMIISIAQDIASSIVFLEGLLKVTDHIMIEKIF